ncbi:hypothetical protein HDK90DRAFT_113612 [Phyllosticta capitalensis]|uniref:Uncharacterized protein n=1 Tax=Phyllosticta capitalensis TaxID=121624 RepID=A0ABR1Y940_9PEZI
MEHVVRAPAVVVVLCSPVLSSFFFSPQHQRQPSLHSPSTSTGVRTIKISPTNLHPTALIASVKMNNFHSDTSTIQARLVDAKTFGKSETKRMTTLARHLQEDNKMLQENLEGHNATVTPSVRNALQHVPLRCVPFPAARYFDDLLPVVADYIETYDTDHRGNPSYIAIWNDMARLQATENGLMSCAALIKDLALANHKLRTSNIHLASSDEKTAFKAISGDCPHPDFFIQNVPYLVSSDTEVPPFDKLSSLHDFEKTTGGRDLVLDQGVVLVSPSHLLAWHPYSTVYVPAFIGQGIPSTGYGLKLADPVAFYDPDLFTRLNTPSGANLWIRKTGSNAIWVGP